MHKVEDHKRCLETGNTEGGHRIHESEIKVGHLDGNPGHNQQHGEDQQVDLQRQDVCSVFRH
jgi:hypothetical protein